MKAKSEEVKIDPVWEPMLLSMACASVGIEHNLNTEELVRFYKAQKRVS